jgi:thiol:disulfide interchange protein
MRSLLRATLLRAAAATLAATSMAPIPAAAQYSTPTVNKHLYSDTADPKADIAAAMKLARRQNKHIILDFGGNWCGDCLVLDYYFHQSPNDAMLAKYFLVVHVDIGHMDHNVDIAEKYKVPIKKGVPALAVLDATGKLLYSQQNKEYEKVTDKAVVTEFLNRWKP